MGANSKSQALKLIICVFRIVAKYMYIIFIQISLVFGEIIIRIEKENACICSSNTNLDYKRKVSFIMHDKKHNSIIDTHKYLLTEMASLWPLNLWMSWQVSGFHRRTNLFFPPDACNGWMMCNNTVGNFKIRTQRHMNCWLWLR